VPGRKSGVRGTGKNTYGGELQALRLAKSMTVAALIAKLHRKGWEVGEDTITNIETGRRILSDSEMVLILLALGAKLEDLSWPPVR